MHTLSPPLRSFYLPSTQVRVATLRTDRPTAARLWINPETEGQGATSALGPARNREGRQEPHEAQ